jgi:glycosyltransferase involved in cell wall biosynthesis
MERRLFIHATNIHQGGGRSLLESIFFEIPIDIKPVYSLDSRMTLPECMDKDVLVKRVLPTIVHRFISELRLAYDVKSEDIVLCFGNLPPLFKLRAYTLVFVQNRYLVDSCKLSGLSFKTRLRLNLERLWLFTRMANVDEFIVQTPSMKSLLEVRTKGKIPVNVMPFVKNNISFFPKFKAPKKIIKKDFIFLYVASGEPHKNHRQLIAAWCLLAKEGIFPFLKLTLERQNFTELCSWLDETVAQHCLKVENLGNLPHPEITSLYDRVDALIYPSFFESFGLPLIEARQAGLPVLASELDYVRDILDPEQSFDPSSVVSIARAVKRYLGLEENPLPLRDTAGFIKHILKSTK